jgi:hypothetical protein
VSGYLTAEDIRRSMDDLWRKSRPPGFADTAPGADEGAERASDEVEAWAAAHPRPCGAVLFPLEPSRDIVTLVVHEAWENGVPVHPLMVPYGGPVQGPRPVTCTREPHPGSPWHWFEGTWWR